jgi:hypothetical protein
MLHVHAVSILHAHAAIPLQHFHAANPLHVHAACYVYIILKNVFNSRLAKIKTRGNIFSL